MKLLNQSFIAQMCNIVVIAIDDGKLAFKVDVTKRIRLAIRAIISL